MSHFNFKFMKLNFLGVASITAESSDLGLPLQLIVASHMTQTKQW